MLKEERHSEFYGNRFISATQASLDLTQNFNDSD